MLVSKLPLVAFNDLYVIATGLTATYIAFASSVKTTFLDILSGFTSHIKEKALKRKEKPQREEETVIAQISYYLKSKLLSPQIEGALVLVASKANEVMEDIRSLEKWANDKQNFHTRSAYLRVISCDCFFWGLFVLFVGVLQDRCSFNINGLLQILLLVMGVCLLHCLLYEHVNIKKFKPKIWTHSLVLICALMVGIVYHNQEIFSFGCGVSAILSVAVCFCGFISYFLMNFIVDVILLVVILCKIFFLQITKRVEEQKKDIARYQTELDKIDTTLSQTDLQKDLSVIPGGEKTTAS